MYRELGVITPYGWVRRFVAEGEYEAALSKLPKRGAFASAFWYERLLTAEGSKVAPDPQAKLRGDAYFDLDLISDEPPSGDTWPRIVQGAHHLLHWVQVNLSILPEQTHVYFSGRRGLHITIPKELLGNPEHPQLHLAYRQLAERIRAYLHSEAPQVKLDLIYDRRRMFRLPNTRHERTNLFKIRIGYDELSLLSWEDLQARADAPRPDPPASLACEVPAAAHQWVKSTLLVLERKVLRRTQSPHPAMRTTPASYPCLSELLSAAIPKGSRNVACAVLASCYLQQGMSFEQAHEALAAYNEAHCQPPLPHDEVTRVVVSIYKHGYRYGCTSLQMLATCRPDRCPIFLHRKTRRICL